MVAEEMKVDGGRVVPSRGTVGNVDVLGHAHGFEAIKDAINRAFAHAGRDALHSFRYLFGSQMFVA